MSPSALWKTIRTDVQHFGVAKTAYDLLFRAINRVTYFKVLKAIKIEAAHADYLESDGRFQWQFFTAQQLDELSKNPAYHISENDLQSAMEKGDECYGALDGGVLACYGWYSNKPTEAAEGLTLHFSPDYIYMFKGFTNPAHRGQRLHAIGMNRALREYIRRDFKGLVSTVESNNFSSLNSCYRMGYEDFGRVYVTKLAGHALVHSSRGCRAYDFYLSQPKLAAKLRPALTAAT